MEDIKTKKKEFSIPVYDLAGKKEKDQALPKEIFSTDINEKLIAQYVRVYLANQRQGNASTKTRGEVTGSTRKIYKQKGTGRARHGSIKAPIFIGGGVAFGPKPRDFSLKINAKQKRKALFMVLSLKYKNNQIIGLSDKVQNITSKTKKFADLIKNIGINKKKSLLVVPKLEKNNLVMAVRNIPEFELTDALSINPYQLLNNENVLILEKSLEILKKHFLKNEN